VFGGFSIGSGSGFQDGLVIGSLAGATSFAVSMVLFVLTMPRMNPRLAVFASLALGSLAAFAVGYLIQPRGGPV